MPPADCTRRLRALPGGGSWSVAEGAMVALGDADAGAVGDYHLPHQVAWALAGEPRGDDARMLELLEPFRPHRGRVLRLIEVAGPRPPPPGPRAPPPPPARPSAAPAAWGRPPRGAPGRGRPR